MRVLLVEDTERVAEAVALGLKAAGFSVVATTTVAAAEAAMAEQRFDLAVVDIGLPDGSGLEWCRTLRRAGHETPVLLLTARADVRDRVAGLDAGADDYLGKPFAMDELVARVRALGRRGPRWTEAVLSFGAVSIDRDRRTLTVGGARLPLTARELDIVALVAWANGRVVPRDEVLEAVWGETGERVAASLDVLVARIRRKLEGHGIEDALRTVRQVGYSWGLERSKQS